MVDPSGTSFGYYGCAIGKGQQAATSEIEKLDVGVPPLFSAVPSLYEQTFAAEEHDVP